MEWLWYVLEGDIISAAQLGLTLYVFRDRIFGQHSLARDMGRLDGKLDTLTKLIAQK